MANSQDSLADGRYLQAIPDNGIAVIVLLIILVAVGFIGKISPTVPTIPIG